MKKLITVALAGVMVLNLAACGGSGTTEQTTAASSDSTKTEAAETQSGLTETRTFKLATDQAVDYPNTIALQSFADEVKEKTDGRIDIEIYPSAQLGDENAYLQQLQFGAVDFAKSSIAPLAQFCTDLNALSLPYLFDSTDHMFKCLDGEIGEEIFASFESANIVGLGFTNNGSRCFFTKTPVHTADDLANMKLRVQSSPMMLGLVESLGGFPQAIASTELYSALQTGAVDGNMNGYQTLYSGSLHEVQPYITEVNVTLALYDFLANKASWEKLSPDTQELLQECATEAAEWGRNYMSETEADVRQEMIDYGVKIYVPTEEELQAFKDGAAPTIDEYKGIVGEEACKAWGIE